MAAVGLAGLAMVTGWPAFITMFFIAGFGVGMAWSYPSVAAQGVVPKEKAGAASGTVLTLLVGIGGISVAVVATVVENHVAKGATLGGAIHAALIGLAAVSLVGVLVTGVLGDAGIVLNVQNVRAKHRSMTVDRSFSGLRWRSHPPEMFSGRMVFTDGHSGHPVRFISTDPLGRRG